MSAITVANKISELIRDMVISIKAVAKLVKMGNYAGALIGLNADVGKIESIWTKTKICFQHK